LALNEFTLDISDGRLNPDLCLRSGQVFRWRKEEDGSWFGVDGSNWYRFQSLPMRGTSRGRAGWGFSGG
ncbi:MAG: hypothetical protein H7Y17_05480, partial [Chlorobia bacterium]|nr:hypothetical protein [Fimbriimonadaceae bacterium]